MTASNTVINVVNRALLQIGARSNVASLDEGSTEANAAKILFQPTFESLARTAPWNCLRQQKKLSLLMAAAGTNENVNGTTLPLPPTPWLYAYAEPSDCLQVRFLVPSLPNSTGTTPLTTASNTQGPWIPGQFQIPFAVAYSTDPKGNPIQIILTNQPQAQAVYTVNQPNPVIWDSLFSQAMVSSLAAFLVPALSLNLPLMEMSVKTADALITQARVRDGNEGSTSQNRNASWMDARVTGTLGNCYGNDCMTPYVAMAWPYVGN